MSSHRYRHLMGAMSVRPEPPLAVQAATAHESYRILRSAQDSNDLTALDRRVTCPRLSLRRGACENYSSSSWAC